MLRYIVRRLLYAIPLLFLLSIVVFVAARATASPEAALRGNPRIKAEDIIRYRADLGLDKSNFEQYTTWLGNFVHGDLGRSLDGRRPVWPKLKAALTNTVVLGGTAVVFALIIGVAIGVLSAVRQYSLFDKVSTAGAFFGLSMPVFWLGLIVQIFFGVTLVRWLNLEHGIVYTSGLKAPGVPGFDLVDRLRHLALPALVVAVQLVAVYSRYMRASMLEVLQSDYLRTARAKGISEGRVIVNHGVRTALIPLTTQAAIDIGLLVGGVVVTESVFQWPGMGVLFLDSIRSGDYVVLLPWLMITATAVVLLNLFADITYAFLDPRIRYD